MTFFLKLCSNIGNKDIFSKENFFKFGSEVTVVNHLFCIEILTTNQTTLHNKMLFKRT